MISHSFSRLPWHTELWGATSDVVQTSCARSEYLHLPVKKQKIAVRSHLSRRRFPKRAEVVQKVVRSCSHTCNISTLKQVYIGAPVWSARHATSCAASSFCFKSPIDISRLLSERVTGRQFRRTRQCVGK